MPSEGARKLQRIRPAIGGGASSFSYWCQLLHFASRGRFGSQRKLADSYWTAQPATGAQADVALQRLSRTYGTIDRRADEDNASYIGTARAVFRQWWPSACLP